MILAAAADNLPFLGRNHMTDVQLNTVPKWTVDKIQAAPPEAQLTAGSRVVSYLVVKQLGQDWKVRGDWARIIVCSKEKWVYFEP